MKHSLFFRMSCVALLSFCILMVSCDSSISDNSIQTEGTNTILFQNWVIQDEEPDFSSMEVPGTWYLFNLYTINAITPNDIEYLTVHIYAQSEYSFQLSKTNTNYIDASNFRTWVFIPDAFFQSRTNLSFYIEQPDGTRNREFESMNFNIQSWYTTDDDDNTYRFGTIPYDLNPEAGEIRKIIRTWENIPLQEQTITIPLSFNVDLNQGPLEMQTIYYVKEAEDDPDDEDDYHVSSTTLKSENLSGSLTMEDGTVTIRMPHFHYLSSTTEKAINNRALLSTRLFFPLYNYIDFERPETHYSDVSYTFSQTTMHALSFLTLRYVLSDDETFDETIHTLTLNSLPEEQIPNSLEQYIPYDTSVMDTFQTFDPDGDSIPEFSYESLHRIRFLADENYASRWDTTPAFDNIIVYSDGAQTMRMRNNSSSTIYGDYENLEHEIFLQRTSTGKYLKIELLEERPITLVEYESMLNGTHLTNPVNVP